MAASPVPAIGMLCWDPDRVPQGLRQLEAMVGNATNPASFGFPIYYRPIPGASAESVIERPSPAVAERMALAIAELAAAGVRAVTTSCGFNAIFQARLARSAPVPVFTSALLQLPLIRSLWGAGARIGVLTARAEALTAAHFRAVGSPNMAQLRIIGLEHCEEWRALFAHPDQPVNLDRLGEQILDAADRAVRRWALQVLLLECTDLPPYARAMRQRTGLPVFDFLTLTEFVHAAVCGREEIGRAP